MLQDDLQIGHYPSYGPPQEEYYNHSHYPVQNEQMSPSSLREAQSSWIASYNHHYRFQKQLEEEEMGQFARYEALQTYTNTCLTDVSQYSSPRQLMKSSMEVTQECSQFQRPFLNKRHSIEAQRQRKQRGNDFRVQNNSQYETQLAQRHSLMKKRKLGRPRREEPGPLTNSQNSQHDAIKGMIFEQKMKRKVDIQKWQNSVFIEIPGVRIRSQEEKEDVKNQDHEIPEVQESQTSEELTDDESYHSRHLEAAKKEFKELFPYLRTKVRKQTVCNVIRITMSEGGPSITL